MLPLAALATLFFNDTVLHVGRWPYIVDWNAYAQALRVRDESVARTIPRDQEGVWAVAAVNGRVRLAQHAGTHAVFCPAYDKSASAFFASLRGRMPVRLCGGVPVAADAPTPEPLP
jgi:hypothetical protein